MSGDTGAPDGARCTSVVAVVGNRRSGTPGALSLIMASPTKMAHLECLNSFFCERLMAVAAELFQAVKATLSDYEEEMERCKQENNHLRRMLTDASINSGADMQNVQTDPPSPTELNSERVPLDSEGSVIQVKVELSTVHQGPEPVQELNDTPVFCTHGDSGKVTETGETSGNPELGLAADSHISVKLEQGDVGVICSDELNDLNSCLVPEDHECPTQFEAEDESGPHCSAHFDFHLQNPGVERLLRSKVFPQAHIKSRAFRCGLCEKSYSTAHGLKIHLRTHTGERPFPCKFCKKTFNQKAHLKEHERIHTGEKPYSCSACGKLFSRTYQVKVHIQNYHPGLATIVKCQEYK